MAKKPTKIEFTVVKANIADEDGKKVLVGERVTLGKKLAAHYRDLGYIEMPLPEFGDDDEADDLGTDTSSKPDDAGAADGETAVSPEPTEGAATEEGAQPEKEDSAKPPAKRRRL